MKKISIADYKNLVKVVNANVRLNLSSGVDIVDIKPLSKEKILDNYYSAVESWQYWIGRVIAYNEDYSLCEKITKILVYEREITEAKLKYISALNIETTALLNKIDVYLFNMYVLNEPPEQNTDDNEDND